MAIDKVSLLTCICLLLLCHGSMGQMGFGQGQQGGRRRFGDQSRCRLYRLNALEPTRRIQSEAGVTEHWDQNNDQLDCAGVAVIRRTIQPQGLLLPSFANAHQIVYIVQGKGITGSVMPGCPETFQASQQSQRRFGEGRSQRSRDQHQKIHHFRQGDILAFPAGVSHWCYNDGETPVVAVTLLDTGNNANQLDRNHREFLLAGSQQQQRGEQQQFGGEQISSGNNILSGFDVETLAEVLGVSRETAERVRNPNDERGNIVRVQDGLHVVRPQRMEEEEEQYDDQEDQEEREGRRKVNGLEEALCNVRIRENIGDPRKADVYTPRGGRITSLNGQKLRILNYLQLSAERGVLYRNAYFAPHWNINSNSVVYVTRGRGRVQIVSNQGRAVFDGELRQGQLVVIPQNFAVVKQASNEGFEWVSFKTNANAMINPIVGKTSTLRGLPEDVIMNSYRISREEARRLKYNMGEEMTVFNPRSQGRPYA